MNSTLFFNREPSRVYITSPSFGIDLSVPWLEASLTPHYEYFDAYGRQLEPPRMIDRYHRFTHLSLNINMGLEPGLFLYYPQARSALEYTRKVFVLSESVPALPERPIWLPPGCWECAYCTTTQEQYLLQCRNCGAPRIGEDASRCWGHPDE